MKLFIDDYTKNWKVEWFYLNIWTLRKFCLLGAWGYILSYIQCWLIERYRSVSGNRSPLRYQPSFEAWQTRMTVGKTFNRLNLDQMVIYTDMDRKIEKIAASGRKRLKMMSNNKTCGMYPKTTLFTRTLKYFYTDLSVQFFYQRVHFPHQNIQFVHQNIWFLCVPGSKIYQHFFTPFIMCSSRVIQV